MNLNEMTPLYDISPYPETLVISPNSSSIMGNEKNENSENNRNETPSLLRMQEDESKKKMLAMGALACCGAGTVSASTGICLLCLVPSCMCGTASGPALLLCTSIVEFFTGTSLIFLHDSY